MSWASDAWDSAKDTAVTWSTGGLNKVYEAGKDSLSPDRSSDNYASKTRARLAREQWEDYKKRFQPYEDELLDKADEGPGKMVGTATEQAGQQFDAGLGVAARQRQRYGLSGAPGEQTQRQNSLARGLSVVGARNQARDDWEEQRRGIMTGMGGK